MQNLETWFERNEAKQAFRLRLQERAARRRSLVDLRPECYVTLAGENPFGEVSSGRLRITGRTCTAKLQYINQYGSAKSTYVDTHDPLRYQLRIQTEDQRRKHTVDIELPFFADYILSYGPHPVLEGDAVTLLRIRQNVCLVLRRTGNGREY